MNAHGPSTTNIDPPDYVRSLELADARGQNEKLRQALGEARESSPRSGKRSTS